MLVTRAAAQAQPLVDALRAAGAEPVLCPLIEIEPIDDGPVDVRGYDWVIVTSANGADELARRRRGDLPRVAAIGDATAATLRRHGLRVDFVPTVATQEGLVAELPRPVGRALFVAAEGARRLVATELPADVRTVYRTRALRPDTAPAADVAVLASPSAARAFESLGLRIPVVSIGPQTTAAAHGLGLDVVVEAARPDVDAVVAAVLGAAR